MKFNVDLRIALLSKEGVATLINRRGVESKTDPDVIGIKSIDIPKFIKDIDTVVSHYDVCTAGVEINKILESLGLATKLQKLMLFILLPRNLFDLDCKEITFFNKRELFQSMTSHFVFDAYSFVGLTKTRLAQVLKSNQEVCYLACIHFPEAFSWMALWHDTELFKTCELPIAMATYVEFYGESLIPHLGKRILEYGTFIMTRKADLAILKIIESTPTNSPHLDCDGDVCITNLTVNYTAIINVINLIKIQGLRTILFKEYSPYIPKEVMVSMLLNSQLPVRYVHAVWDELCSGFDNDLMKKIPRIYEWAQLNACI